MASIIVIVQLNANLSLEAITLIFRVQSNNYKKR
jgi:hypothetical protein